MTASLTESEYLTLAERCLAGVADWLETLDPDEVDYSTKDGMVTLEFPDGIRFVLNRQGAAKQMWFAAVDRAFHYRWDAGRRAWVDDKDGHALFDRLAEAVGAKVGHPVAPPGDPSAARGA